jgi:hypothetical protein
MTAPAAAVPANTATIKLPVPGGTPVAFTMPAALVDSPGAIAVTHGRVFQRDAKGQYADVTANAFVDPTGTAVSADVADLHAAIADLTMREAAFVKDLTDAHAVIGKLVSSAKAIPADVEKDADGMLARLKKWIKKEL